MNGEFRDRSLDQYKSTRTVLHDKRIELNRKINKDLLLKRGASNLIDASHDKKSKEKALKEINELNYDLQNLKTELDRMNCSFSDYQTNTTQLPMIPIPMKDTESIDMRPFCQRFIEEHYFAEPSKFSSKINDFNNLRSSIVSPSRTTKGLEDHKLYYSLLTLVDHRFFSKEVKRDFWFTWNDSFTGVSFKQLSLAFEKGSVLFNLGALYSQISTHCKRDTAESLTESSNLFVQGARVFRMLRENFSYAPSPDMASAMLDLLIKLLMLQSQECNFLKFGMNPDGENENYVRLGQYIEQAIALAKKYESVTHNSSSLDLEILPNSWTGLFEIKGKYYRAQAYYRFAAALLGLVMYGNESDSNSPEQVHEIDLQIEQELQLWMNELSHVVRFTQPINTDDSSTVRSKRGFASLSKKTGAKSKPPKRSHSVLGGLRKTSQTRKVEEIAPIEEVPIQIPKNRYEACQVGIACLREAISYMEDVIRINNLNEELRDQQSLKNFVNRLLDDWKYQRQQLQPTLQQLQKRFAPDQSIDGSLANGENGTVRGRKKLRKSTSSASQYAKRGSVQSNSSQGQSNKHVAPRLLAAAELELNEIPPRVVFAEDFPLIKDPFEDLGPLEIFNASNFWTQPVTVTLKKDPAVGFGFCIKGDAPIEIMSCDEGSPAEINGLRAGDILVGLNGRSTLWLTHAEAVNIVKSGFVVSPEARPNDQMVQLTVVRAAKPPTQPRFNSPRPGTPSGANITNSMR